MRIKRLAEDFKVEELVDLPVNEGGAYAYYQVEKWGQPTLLVRDALADHLKVTSSNVVFLGSRDKNALAIQYASIRQRVPEVVEGAISSPVWQAGGPGRCVLPILKDIVLRLSRGICPKRRPGLSPK
jgi:tRNA(Glu) U13 pseudouridine synthase TruD